LQAVLWYYEQALYRAHGLPVESWSFSDAAKRVSKEQNAAEPQQDAFDFGHNEKPAESQKALGFMSWNTVPKVDATGRPYGRPDLNK
jgi:hypothetical protein